MEPLSHYILAALEKPIRHTDAGDMASSVLWLRSPGVLLSVLILYILLVRALRYRRSSSVKTKYGSHRDAFAGMSLGQAQKIINILGELEFPFTFEKALQFALFKTYGIPSISKLLVETRQFSDTELAHKRYVDTAVIVTSIVACPWGNAEWLEAVSRMNCIHNEYRQAGKISNADMLYTLALFVWEPLRWIGQREWRALTDVEKNALGVYWKAMGDAMQIDYADLPGYEKGRTWRDGLEWVDAVGAWAEDYEARHMVVHETNVATAGATVEILLWTVPKPLKGFGRRAVGALMSVRLRRSMAYPDPPAWVQTFVDGALSLRRLVLRHLALPRPEFMSLRLTSDEKSPQGNRYTNWYQSMPFYVKPTLRERWGPQALLRRLQGIPLPGDGGDKYHPQGFRPRDVGPDIGRKGQESMERSIEGLEARRRCPMAPSV